MAIHLVIGFDTAGPTSAFRPIYHGRDADAARAACEKWEGETSLWLRNPEGVRKTNPRLSAARDAAARAAEFARQPAPVTAPLSPERLAAKVEQLERENARLRAATGGDLTALSAAPVPTGSVEEGSLPLLDGLAADPAPETSETSSAPVDPGTLAPKGKAKGK